METQQLPIYGAMILTPRIFADERGFFKETYAKPRYESAGIDDIFVQDNVSRSQRGVLRGLHGDRRMSKLVQVLAGGAFDVIVDLRRESPTYLNWCGVNLDCDNHAQIYIPSGCLHGFLSLADGTILHYKQSATYDPTQEIGVAWNDPKIAIEWPLDGREPLLSPKDAANRTLRELGYV